MVCAFPDLTSGTSLLLSAVKCYIIYIQQCSLSQQGRELRRCGSGVVQ